ncbi:MAG: P-II family nitrogen regulator, partial [Planctomycetota bacterium]
AVDDDTAPRVIEAILAATRSGPEGKIGDGKIFVYDLADVIRIRTGERGPEAL